MTRWATGRNESRATAEVAASAARLAGSVPAGVHHLHAVTTLADLPVGPAIDLA